MMRMSGKYLHVAVNISCLKEGIEFLFKLFLAAFGLGIYRECKKNRGVQFIIELSESI